MLPACIQVCPVEIPGRGGKMQEQPVTSVSALADMLVQGLALQVGLAPFILLCGSCYPKSIS